MVRDPSGALLALLVSRFVFVVRPDGQKRAALVTAGGINDYAIDSVAFRDVARRVALEAGHPFDDAIFATAVERLTAAPFEPAAQPRTVRRAIGALQAVADEARAGKIKSADLYPLGDALRAAIEATA